MYRKKEEGQVFDLLSLFPYSSDGFKVKSGQDPKIAGSKELKPKKSKIRKSLTTGRWIQLTWMPSSSTLPVSPCIFGVLHTIFLHFYYVQIWLNNPVPPFLFHQDSYFADDQSIAVSIFPSSLYRERTRFARPLSVYLPLKIH